MTRGVLLVVLLVPSTIHARDSLDLLVHRAPLEMPARLAMREHARSAPGKEAAIRAADDGRYAPLPSDLTDLSQRVVFHFRLGYGIDQIGLGLYAQGAQKYDTGLYSFGDAVLGTSGLGLASLSSYASARLADRTYLDTGSTDARDSTAERVPLLVRSAYAQMTDMGPTWLKPLSVRGGRQYHHAFTLVHYDGVSARYQTSALDALLLMGQPVVLHDAAVNPSPLFGGEVRVRQRALVLVMRALHLGKEGQLQAQSAYDLSPRFTLRSHTRLRAGRLARLGGAIEVRFSPLSQLLWELEETTRAEESYRFIDALGSGRLRLGPTLARLRTSVRMGTVFFGNVDALGRVTFAYEHGEGQSSFAPTYLDVAVALDARLRRGFALSAELHGRLSDRHDLAELYGPGIPELLTDTGAFGDETLRDVALGMRYSLGAQRMSFSAHGFAEVVRGDPPFDLVGDIYTDVRAGVRVRLDGWIGKRLRVLGEYDVASVPRTTWFSGVQNLRLVGEASF